MNKAMADELLGTVKPGIVRLLINSLLCVLSVFVFIFPSLILYPAGTFLVRGDGDGFDVAHVARGGSILHKELRPVGDSCSISVSNYILLYVVLWLF
jgi:hypothetical protein